MKRKWILTLAAGLLVVATAGGSAIRRIERGAEMGFRLIVSVAAVLAAAVVGGLVAYVVIPISF